MYSDNGTNFVGANNELQQLSSLLQCPDHQQGVMDTAAENGIRWHFIPPRAPEFGGLWETAVKSTKFHLKRTVQEARLTYEQFSTYLALVEAALNSRPLTERSDDPTDVEPLTPGHFLIVAPLTAPLPPTKSSSDSRESSEILAASPAVISTLLETLAFRVLVNITKSIEMDKTRK
ncbi:uncharacterized protein LOC126835799 [Adelges cooleyi]|uniref:uncharacterized protein LOC126835799 n=1 Tax=Adelges cooleyi TaxID=133065 RepID=UPI00217FF074|nr:uncharacterized protein LOC126835799 [Adelges cooleyi]